MKNLIDFTDEEIARAVHRMDGASDMLEGSELGAWNHTRSLIISNCEQLREVDKDDLVSELVDDTSDAYALEEAHLYDPESWRENIQDLVNSKYSADAIRWIVHSKIARWAHDDGISMLEYINRHVGEARLRDWMRRK